MKQFEDTFKPQGFFGICNHGGLEIEISASGNSVRYRYDFGEDNNDPNLDTKIKETEIIYEPNGNDEAKARCHNAGPAWRSRISATDGYWEKVKRILLV